MSNISYKSKLLGSMILLSCCSIIIISSFLYETFRRDATEKVSIAYTASLNTLSSQLAYVFKDLKDEADWLSNNGDINARLQTYNHYLDDPHRVFVKSVICNLLDTNSNDYNITYHAILRSEYDVFFSDDQEFLYNYDSISILETEFIEHQFGWFDSMSMSDCAIRKPSFYVINPITNASTEDYLGVVRVGFESDFLLHILDTASTSDIIFSIINENGDILCSQDTSLISKNLDFIPQETTSSSQWVNINQQRYYLSSIANTPWKLVASIPYENINVVDNSIATTILISSIVCILLSILLANILSSKMVSRIDILALACDKIRDDNFQVDLPDIEPHDQVDQLGLAIKNMSQRLESMKLDIISTEQEKNEAQIKFLRAQLNPHFLCNTLKTVTALAAVNRTDEIEQIILYLSDILRESIAWDSSLSSIEEELRLSKGYMDIMEIRKNYTFEYFIHLNPFLNHILVPRLILQPIIENAIIHGLKQGSDTIGEILIDINFSPANSNLVQITISDNGNGMGQEQLELLQTQIKQAGSTSLTGTQHIGMVNVAKRLGYYYDRYTIDIQSNAATGTTVILIFNIIKNQNT